MNNEFTTAYIEALLWADCGPDSECATCDLSDFANETIEQINKDCAAFMTMAEPLLAGLSLAQAGHDFWLTRNHHGAGFWDRGLGNTGEQLTAIAHKFSEVSPIKGDDGLIYLA